jgi:hypothetical protein
MRSASFDAETKNPQVQQQSGKQSAATEGSKCILPTSVLALRPSS